MSADRYPNPRREKRSAMQEILDFGPDQSELAPDVAERIQRIVDQLDDINKRIDKLTRNTVD